MAGPQRAPSSRAVSLTDCLFSLDSDKKPTAPPKKPGTGKRRTSLAGTGQIPAVLPAPRRPPELLENPVGPVVSLQKPGLMSLWVTSWQRVWDQSALQPLDIAAARKGFGTRRPPGSSGRRPSGGPARLGPETPIAGARPPTHGVTCLSPALRALPPPRLWPLLGDLGSPVAVFM